MKSIKKNTLKPTLFIGLALLITTIVFANAYDVPRLRINGYTFERSGNIIDRVILFCDVYDDGGADVSQYIGEIKYRNDSNWTIKCTQNPNWLNCNKCDLEFYDLEQGKEAEFRGIAVNRAGGSEPAPLEQMVKLW